MAVGQNLGSTDQMVQDGVRAINSKLQALRATNAGIAEARGNPFLHEVAAARASELSSVPAGFEGCVPIDDRSPTERATSGKPLTNGAFGAFPGSDVTEFLMAGTPFITEALEEVFKHPRFKERVEAGTVNAIGIGIGGGGQFGALFCVLLGHDSGDRSGVLETEVPLRPSPWDPTDVTDLPGHRVIVKVTG